MELAVAIYLVLLAALVGGAAGALLYRRHTREQRTRPQHLDLVVVNTRRPDDQSIRGMWIEGGSEWCLLNDAYVLQSDNTWMALPGQAVIPMGAIAWVQKVAAESPTPRA